MRLRETGSHRIPTQPPFEVYETVRFLGVPDGSTMAAGIAEGAIGTVIRNEPGRQGSGEVLFKDKHGELADVTVDGYSIVQFEGVTVAVTQSQAKYFERSDDLVADMALR